MRQVPIQPEPENSLALDRSYIFRAFILGVLLGISVGVVLAWVVLAIGS